MKREIMPTNLITFSASTWQRGSLTLLATFLLAATTISANYAGSSSPKSNTISGSALRYSSSYSPHLDSRDDSVAQRINGTRRGQRNYTGGTSSNEVHGKNSIEESDYVSNLYHKRSTSSKYSGSSSPSHEFDPSAHLSASSHNFDRRLDFNSNSAASVVRGGGAASLRKNAKNTPITRKRVKSNIINAERNSSMKRDQKNRNFRNSQISRNNNFSHAASPRKPPSPNSASHWAKKVVRSPDDNQDFDDMDQMDNYGNFGSTDDTNYVDDIDYDGTERYDDIQEMENHNNVENYNHNILHSYNQDPDHIPEGLLRVPCSIAINAGEDGRNRHGNHHHSHHSHPGQHQDCDTIRTPIAAFVDTGAQVTVISASAARRAGILHLMDRRYAGRATGVGHCKVLGRIPARHVHFFLGGGYDHSYSFGQSSEDDLIDGTYEDELGGFSDYEDPNDYHYGAGSSEKNRVMVKMDGPALTVLEGTVTKGVDVLLGLDVLHEWEAEIRLSPYRPSHYEDDFHDTYSGAEGRLGAELDVWPDIEGNSMHSRRPRSSRRGFPSLGSRGSITVKRRDRKSFRSMPECSVVIPFLSHRPSQNNRSKQHDHHEKVGASNESAQPVRTIDRDFDDEDSWSAADERITANKNYKRNHAEQSSLKKPPKHVKNIPQRPLRRLPKPFSRNKKQQMTKKKQHSSSSEYDDSNAEEDDFLPAASDIESDLDLLEASNAQSKTNQYVSGNTFTQGFPYSKSGFHNNLQKNGDAIVYDRMIASRSSTGDLPGNNAINGMDKEGEIDDEDEFLQDVEEEDPAEAGQFDMSGM